MKVNKVQTLKPVFSYLSWLNTKRVPYTCTSLFNNHFSLSHLDVGHMDVEEGFQIPDFDLLQKLIYRLQNNTAIII